MPPRRLKQQAQLEEKEGENDSAEGIVVEVGMSLCLSAILCIGDLSSMPRDPMSRHDDEDEVKE